MKNIHWKTVTALAALLVFIGFLTSVWGHFSQNFAMLTTGFIIIVIVCASWWFWVVIMVQTMVEYINLTANRLGDIKTGIQEARSLLKEYEKSKLDK
jgi:uncharacterized membrane protein